jgi:uncharacterized protein YndB with AHSA1/START domain
MTDLQSPAVPAIVLRRTYPASRDRVFDAWTNPETAARFLGPGEVEATDIRMDARVGGTYSITMRSPKFGVMVVNGTYREVRRPERLSMTWRWEEDSPADEYDSLLTLEFNDRNGETELVLTHEALKSVESRNNHEEGWTAIVDQLATVF